MKSLTEKRRRSENCPPRSDEVLWCIAASAFVICVQDVTRALFLATIYDKYEGYGREFSRRGQCTGLMTAFTYQWRTSCGFVEGQ